MIRDQNTFTLVSGIFLGYKIRFGNIHIFLKHISMTYDKDHMESLIEKLRVIERELSSGDFRNERNWREAQRLEYEANRIQMELSKIPHLDPKEYRFNPDY